MVKYILGPCKYLYCVLTLNLRSFQSLIHYECCQFMRIRSGHLVHLVLLILKKAYDLLQFFFHTNFHFHVNVIMYMKQYKLIALLAVSRERSKIGL